MLLKKSNRLGDIMKIKAIIQARTGSTRLPNKVLLEINGKPLLWHVINRLSFSKKLDQVILATTDNQADDLLEDFAKKYGINYFRGSENDVLDRYYQCAKLNEADVIVRITADCPLIDPEVVDKVIENFLNNKENCDYCANVLPPTFPDGLDTEVFSFKTLERAWNEAKLTSEREHVTAYIYKNPEKFKLQNVANEIDLSSLRWTVDTENDFKFVKEVYQQLGKDKEIFYMKDILDFLEKNPELKDINSNSKRNEGYDKSLAEDKLITPN